MIVAIVDLQAPPQVKISDSLGLPHYRERGIGRRRGEVRFFRSLLLLLSIEKWLCFPFLVPPIPDKSGWLRSLPLPSSLISSLRRQ